jgi:hypothetical protein
MALPETSLSRACRSVADYVQGVFTANGNPIQVRLGTPAAAVPAPTDTDHRINLFFYRFEPPGFGSFELSGETWWIRVHVVVTAFAVDEGRISAGENDMRLLGEVIRMFHETPVIGPFDVGGEQLVAQAVFQPLGLDQINQLWGAQGDVAYRPSVAYELALVPILPKKPSLPAPMVGAIGADTRPNMDHVAPSVAAPSPPVTPMFIDTNPVDWAPQIALVLPTGYAQSIALQVGSPDLAAFKPAVIAAGLVGAPITFSWQIWDKTAGWRAAAAGTDQAATVGVARLPADASTVTGTAVTLPFTATPGQALVYAQRTVTRSDGAVVTVRSNPILVTLYPAPAVQPGPQRGAGR